MIRYSIKACDECHHYKRTRLKIKFRDWFDSFVIAVSRGTLYLVYIIICIRMRHNEFYIFNEIDSRLPLSFCVSSVAGLSLNEFISTTCTCHYLNWFHMQIKISTVVFIIHGLSNSIFFWQFIIKIVKSSSS